jgi:hypothetical protein
MLIKIGKCWPDFLRDANEYVLLAGRSHGYKCVLLAGCFAGRKRICTARGTLAGRDCVLLAGRSQGN